MIDTSVVYLDSVIFLNNPFLIKIKNSKTRYDLLILGLLILINGIVLSNAIRHTPYKGYDGVQHARNIEVIATGRLPSPSDSREFFSPPLPYLLPALLLRTTGVDLDMAGKVAQILNVFLSIGVTVFLLKICELTHPSQPHIKRNVLLFLAILPVYYKTFAFVRGEPYIVFFTLVSSYQSLQVIAEGKISFRRMIGLGITLGLAVLARQWGVLLIPPIVAFLSLMTFKARLGWLRLLGGLTICFGLCFLISGWFYLYLKANYGSLTTFNRQPYARFSFSNQPASFYFGLGNGNLFREPVREAFANQLMPTFYSEIWGDYWFYFLVYGKDKRNDDLFAGLTLYEMLRRDHQPRWFRTNRSTIAPYLARLNIVGLFPTGLALAALVLGMVESLRYLFDPSPSLQRASVGLFMLLISVSLLGYLWFLIMYPNNLGDTIKATYMLHLFPLISVFVGRLMVWIRNRSLLTYRVLLYFVGFVLLHNLPAFFSRFSGGG